MEAPGDVLLLVDLTTVWVEALASVKSQGWVRNANSVL